MDVCCVYSRLLWPDVFRNTTDNQKNGRFCVFYLFFFKQLMKYWKHIMYEVICEVIFSLLLATRWHLCTTTTRRRRPGQTTLKHDATRYNKISRCYSTKWTAVDAKTARTSSGKFFLFFFVLHLSVKLSAGIKAAIKQTLFRGISPCFQTPDAECYMKCPRCIFHGDSAIVYSTGSGFSLSSTGVLLFECL